MLFQSFEFLLLCPLVVLIYFVLPVRLRWVWVLLTSWGFYMYWNPWYIFILLASTLTDYVAGLMLGREGSSERIRRYWLYLSLVVNLGLLAVFKYFNFFSENFAWVARHFNPDFEPYLVDILLPIGISFYTFQTLGYTIDVYRRKQEPVYHFGTFAVYVAFFPQLVAGPIERAKDLLPQLHFDYDFDTQRVTEGLRLFLWGLFKKVVIADRIGVYVTMVYANPQDYNGIITWIAGALFCFQIYYDFSAYQDMALGVARVLGVRLSKNFENLIVFRSSFQAFWAGWHMTLTNWIRDYVYWPIVGKSRSRWRLFGGLMLLFFLIGLWHGAKWTYITWGVLHGTFLVVERIILPFRRRMRRKFGTQNWRTMCWLFNFNLYVVTILFFRPGDWMDSFGMLKNILTIPFQTISFNINPGMLGVEMWLMFFLLGVSVLFEYLRRHAEPEEILDLKVTWQRWGVYILLGLAILFLQIPEQKEFIYFEF